MYRFWTVQQEASDWSYENSLIAPRQEFITFEVEASEWAVIVLLKDFTSQDRYEIHLGVPVGIRQKSYIHDAQVTTKT